MLTGFDIKAHLIDVMNETWAAIEQVSLDSLARGFQRRVERAIERKGDDRPPTPKTFKSELQKFRIGS